MSSTVFQLVEDKETWKFVFDNLIKWERANFPKGSWYMSTKEFRDMQKQGTYHAVIAWTLKDGKRHMSGYTSWWFDRNNTCWINEVFVVKQFQRQGIAYGMMTFVLNLIAKRDKRVARIWVVEENEPMLTLQRRFMKEGYYQLEKPSNFWLDYYNDGRKLRYIEFRGRKGLTKPTVLS